eukprot:superscaffoldBa00004773_g19424
MFDIKNCSRQLPEGSSLNSCFVNAGLSTLELYELDDDEKRKEFLDDLFSFMQKRVADVAGGNGLAFTDLLKM